jgi:hypothetical protein
VDRPKVQELVEIFDTEEAAGQTLEAVARAKRKEGLSGFVMRQAENFSSIANKTCAEVSLSRWPCAASPDQQPGGGADAPISLA